jgi:pSer/pThr/pTyr-binding forkhead associated (FHA) protein
MARYRLRFQLQQLELRHGATVIGRGEDCDLSVEDPLVSRRHARLLVNEDGITLEDLGSRNGVFLNGNLLRGTVDVKDGDRVRVGTREFVIGRLDGDSAPPSDAKATGDVRTCGQCGFPYPHGHVACPHCGTMPTEEMLGSPG